MSSFEGATVLRGRAVIGDAVVPVAVVAVGGGLVVHAGPAADVLPLLDTTSHAGLRALPAGAVLLPGLVDLHCHGAAGTDFAGADASGSARAAAHHLAHGTTSLLASVVSLRQGATSAALRSLGPLVGGSNIQGVHLEGPYLSVARCGAQDPRVLRDPDLAELAEWLERAQVATMTLAPERPGALAAAAVLAAAGAVPAVGHTDADERTTSGFLRAVAAGGRPALVTHLFNGMRPLHHRDPGPVAACLAAAARGEAVVELIADGVHLDDGTVRTVLDLVGPGAVALVTDAMAATGMGDGTYRLGALDVDVTAGVARLAGGGSIAGGTTRLLDVVRRLVLEVGRPLADVVRAASATPAAVLGRADELGSLLPGRRADLLVVGPALQPLAVMRGGVWTTVAGPP